MKSRMRLVFLSLHVCCWV